MRYGYVKKLSFDRGFGFIAQERGSDVYFHATAVAEQAFNRILIDQPVKFDLAPRVEGDEDRGLRAAIVVLLDRMPGGILQEAPTSMAKHHPKARQKKPTWRQRTASDSNVGVTGQPDEGSDDIQPTQQVGGSV